MIGLYRKCMRRKKMSDVRVIKLNESVYSHNDNQAEETRRMLNDKNVFFVNIM